MINLLFCVYYCEYRVARSCGPMSAEEDGEPSAEAVPVEADGFGGFYRGLRPALLRAFAANSAAIGGIDAANRLLLPT